MGLLGLDPIHPWAQSENRDPTDYMKENEFLKTQVTTLKEIKENLKLFYFILFYILIVSNL